MGDQIREFSGLSEHLVKILDPQGVQNGSKKGPKWVNLAILDNFCDKDLIFFLNPHISPRGVNL